MTPSPLRAAIYARVSTLDQQPENQLRELQKYVTARGWTFQEYVDKGISGAMTSGRRSIDSSRTPSAGGLTC